MNLNNKKVLVTGGTGMIGSEVVHQLLEKSALVKVVSIEDNVSLPDEVEYEKVDLRYFDVCKKVCDGFDVVFNMAGVKGSPLMTRKRPASFFVPMLQFDTNMMEAARLADVDWYLFTSSVGVYGDFESPEDRLWDLPPSKNDWYAGWAKRIGEMQAETYSIQYGWDRVSIIRPANVFGKKDNFDPETGMVIPSLISRIENGESPLTVWGDGSAVRDFIYAKDVAKICCFAVENEITKPINAGTGVGISIKQLTDAILRHTKNKPEVIWDKTKPSGDPRRVLNTQRLQELGFSEYTNFDDAISDILEWYHENKDTVNNRYNSFKEK